MAMELETIRMTTMPIKPGGRYCCASCQWTTQRHSRRWLQAISMLSFASTKFWILHCGLGRLSFGEGATSFKWIEVSGLHVLVFIFLNINNRTLQTSMFLMFSSRHVKGGYKWLHPLTWHHPLSNLWQFIVVWICIINCNASNSHVLDVFVEACGWRYKWIETITWELSCIINESSMNCHPNSEIQCCT